MRGFTLGVLALVALAAWLFAGVLGWMPWPQAWLAGFALAAATHALVVASGFALARLCTHSDGARAPRGWLAAMPREIWLSMRNMYADIPWRHRWPTRMPANARGAVLLVHGYGCNRGVWRDLDTWLAERGWVVGGLDLTPPHADIDTFGRQVAAAARELAARSGFPQVAVVAHSMGGLAMRAALRIAPDAPIRCAITLGTPHRGTWHARLGRGACARQMRLDSPWQHALRAAEPAAMNRFACVASHHDNIVCPVERAVLPGAETLIVRGVGHMALVQDETVRAFIEEKLSDPRR